MGTVSLSDEGQKVKEADYGYDTVRIGRTAFGIRAGD